MLKNRVVVRYTDGRILKGITWDFQPNRESFHIADPGDERKIAPVSVAGVKAIFFVKTFEGDRFRKAGIPPDSWYRGAGQRLKVTFRDGEVIYGAASAYTPGRKGFFIVPADGDGNNERAYVFTDATLKVEPIRTAAPPAAAAR
jgi:hypothetical protein